LGQAIEAELQQSILDLDTRESMNQTWDLDNVDPRSWAIHDF
jgi:hypothetical protein